MLSLSAFLTYENKTNLTNFSTSFINKRLFRDISYIFLKKMVLISIVSLSLSSNELGHSFNCDPNLLILKSLLLISNKKIPSCNWLAINNNF